MMRWSLKCRLAFFVATGTASLSAAGSLAIWQIGRMAVYDRVDTMLRSPGRRLTERTHWDTDWQGFDQSLQLVFGEDWSQRGICRVIGRGPRFRDYYTGPGWPEDLALQYPENQLPLPGDRSEMSRTKELLEVREPLIYSASALDGRSFRMVNLANRDLTIHLGFRTEPAESRLTQLASRLVLGSVLLTALMAGLTWLIAMRALRPVGQIAATAREITAKRLDLRVGEQVGGDAEFRDLIEILNQTIDRLEKSFHQATRFSADASHELKTPITNLFAEVTTRLNHCEPGSEELPFLVGMLQELDRVRSVLGGLLLLSKADSGLLTLSRETIQIRGFLEDLVADASISASGAGLSLAQDFGRLELDSTVDGDPVMLTQAFHNLFRNAVLHNREGGSIQVAAWNDPGDSSRIGIRIRNSGGPIPPELRERVFERFQKGSGGGTGLGLNIVREILVAHGGSVDLESCEGDVSEVSFVVKL